MKISAFLPFAMAVASASLGGTAQAATTLDFNGNICGPAGNQACADGSQIGQSYGDTSAVDVSYRSANAITRVTTDNFLRFWNPGYGNLARVVYGGTDATSTFAEIVFAARPGFEVTLLGFDSACFQNRASCLNTPFSISEIGGNIAALGTLVNPAGGRDTQTFNLPFSSTGFVLRWGPDNFNTGLDNISFDSRAISSAVPEPATWAMMLFGLGFIGGAMRLAKRRKKMSFSYA